MWRLRAITRAATTVAHISPRQHLALCTCSAPGVALHGFNGHSQAQNGTLPVSHTDVDFEHYVYTDGACRGNPVRRACLDLITCGASMTLVNGGGVWLVVCDRELRCQGLTGAGAAVVRADTGEVVAQSSTFIGSGTNNTAEYWGVIFGLQLAAVLGLQNVTLRMDSKLVACQVHMKHRQHVGLVSCQLQVACSCAVLTAMYLCGCVAAWLRGWSVDRRVSSARSAPAPVLECVPQLARQHSHMASGACAARAQRVGRPISHVSDRLLPGL